MPQMACQTENIFREAREALMLTRGVAADEIGVGERSLARYELGESVPSPDVVSGMSRLYGKRVVEIYCTQICPLARQRKAKLLH